MTSTLLSSSTQNLISIALNSAGQNNQNYSLAYQGIYNDILAYANAHPGVVDLGTLDWFSQAYLINTQAFSPNAGGTFIWNYTEAAAVSEGTVVSDSDMQQASDAIAKTVFQQLKTDNYNFDFTTFNPQNIVKFDAGAGIGKLNSLYSGANFSFAIWGGTLFARTQLNDPTYVTDYSLKLAPGSRDCKAILAGESAGMLEVGLHPDLYGVALAGLDSKDGAIEQACSIKEGALDNETQFAQSFSNSGTLIGFAQTYTDYQTAIGDAIFQPGNTQAVNAAWSQVVSDFSGYYLVQSGDTWASVAAQYGLDAIALEDMNSKFMAASGSIVSFNISAPVTNFSAGAIIRIPGLNTSDVIQEGQGAPSLAILQSVTPQQKIICDLDSDRWYITAASLDGSDAGKLQFVGQEVFGTYAVNPPPISQITNVTSAWPYIQIGSTGYGNWGAIQIDTATYGANSSSNIIQLPGWYDVQPGDTYASIGALRNENPSILASTNPGTSALTPGTYLELTGNFGPMSGGQTNGTYPASFSGTFSSFLGGSDGVLNLAGLKLAILGGVPNLSSPGSFTNRGIVDIVDGNGNLVNTVAIGSSFTVYSDSTPGSSSAYIVINGQTYTLNPNGTANSYATGDILSGAMTQSADGNGNPVVADVAGSGTASFNTGSYTTWDLGAGTNTVELVSGQNILQAPGNSTDYTISYSNATGQITLIDRIASRTGQKNIGIVSVAGEIDFADGFKIGLGSELQSKVYGGTSDETFNITQGNSYITGGISYVNGGGGTNTATFGYQYTFDYRLHFVENADGSVTESGLTSSPVTLANIQYIQQVITYPNQTLTTNYALDVAPVGGGNLTVNSVPVGSYNLVVDSAGNDNLTFNSQQVSYWYAGLGNDTATFTAGQTYIYMPGAQSNYTLSANGLYGLTITDNGTNGNGHKTLVLNGGIAGVTFAGGGGVDVGSVRSSSGSNTSTLIYANSNTLGANWLAGEDTYGHVIINGANAGTGIDTLVGITLLKIQNSSNQIASYDVVNTAVSGGGQTVATPTDGASGTLVVDGAGNDALTFSSSMTSYWYVGGGNNSASLSSGKSEIYFSGAYSSYSVKGQGTNNISIAGGGYTNTINMSGGIGDLVFADGTDIAVTTGTGATQLTGTSGNDTFTLSSGTNYNVQGNGGSDTAVLSGAAAPSGLWGFSTDGAGDVFLNGGAAGFSSVSELTGIQTLQFGSNKYGLVSTPSAGATQTIGNNNYGNIVVDGQGSDNLTFNTTGGTNYWYVGNGTDTATLQNGTTDIYLQGSASQYGVTTALNQVTITGPNGTKTINIGAGKGEIDYVNGSTVTQGIHLGSGDSSAQEPVQVGGTGPNLFVVPSGVLSTLTGGSGVNTANFTLSGGNDSMPDARWGFAENALGQITAHGPSIGYNGSAVMSNIQQVVIGPSFDVAQTNPAGGSLTIATPTDGAAGTLVTDGPGNDTLTFNSTSNNYWSVGGGTDSATMNSGKTEIYVHGSASQYTLAYNGNGVLTVTDTVAGRDGTRTISLAGGTGDLNFGDGNVYGLADNNRQTIYAGTTAGTITGTGNNDIFYASLASDTFVGNGSGGLDIVAINAGPAPSGLWNFATDGSGNVTVNGTNAGYNATLILQGIQAVKLGGLGYMLATTPSAGGTLNIGNVSYGSGTIVVDGNGNDTLTFNASSPYDTEYWYAGNGNDSVTLQSGKTEMYFQGTPGQYGLAYASNTLTLTGPNGTKTIHLSGGMGDIAFVNGSAVTQTIGLGQGSTPEVNEYGGSAPNSFVVTSGFASTISGGSGANTVNFSGVGNDSSPDSRWGFLENSSGQLTIQNSQLGYTGSVTMTNISKLNLGQTWDVVTMPVAGGSATIGAPSSGSSGTLVTDGPGNDALTFTSAITNYWSVGGGSDTASLNSGNTQITFHGALAQYTVSFDNAGTLTITDSVAGRDGTKAIMLNGGTGDIRFTDNLIGLNDSSRQSVYSGTAAETIAGTAYNDVFNIGSGADTITGNGGPDHYRIGTGATTETIVNGVAASNTAQGEIDFLGSLTENNLWFQQSNNDLVIDALGTTRQTVVKNWFASGATYAQTAEIVSADGLKLDTGVNALVQAMASFSASHSAFNPQTAGTTMPTDPSVQGALASNWHH